MLQRIKNLKSGIRTLSVNYGEGTLRLGVNLKKGEDVGLVNRYNVEFNTRDNEPVLNCIDYGAGYRLLFPKKVAEVEQHINKLLDKEGYFTEW